MAFAKAMKVGRAMRVNKSKAASELTKVMKVQKRKSIIARGKLARYLVFSGKREKTAGGIRQAGICKNKRGRYVSRKASAHGQKMFKNIRQWNNVFKDARGQLNCQGFVAINGRTLVGKALYVRMRKLIASLAGVAEETKREEVKSEKES